jgi:hypothetical protein
MTVVWDKEIKAFVHLETGRVLAPRLDEDGIDLFLLRTRTIKKRERDIARGRDIGRFHGAKRK